MEKKDMKFVEIKMDIHIGGACTSQIVEKFKRLITYGVIDTSKAALCTVNYVVRDNKVEDGPVRIYFLNGIRVKLNLTAGYGGTGPHDTCKVLKLCNFDFDKEDILAHQDVVNFKCCKKFYEDVVYHFGNLDGSCEYLGM